MVAVMDNGRTSASKERHEDMDSVKVCVRIRPLSSKERQDQTKSCIRIAASLDGLTRNHNDDTNDAPQQLIVGKDRAFTFDTILGISSSQEETYRVCVAPLVQGFIEGYNATILAYGQTGTGKTHTMSGSGFDARGGEQNEEMQGIIPRVIKAIFQKIQDNQKIIEYTLRVEYIEIYNEELRDLLHPETTSKQLSIREDGEGNIVIAGAKSEIAPTKEAVFRHLVIGGASRATGSTLMNEQSSRSHAIFSLILQQNEIASGEIRKSKFHLVDLAGSERAKRTGAVAGRFKESVSINQGLLALGNVISALSDEKRRNVAATATGGNSGGVHVPYRDSKLTRLLQDSLGGNSKTLMIACVSPATINFEETLNTLKYANRAKNIKNRPIVNQQDELDAKQKADDEVLRMKVEIANLQTQLEQTQTRPRSSRSSAKTPSITSSTSTVSLVDQELGQAKKQLKQYGDVVESMRGYSLEAITSLIAMERDIKPLGRPVQQRLNEIVKLLNATIQKANSVNVKRSNGSKSERDGDRELGPETTEDDVCQRLAKELKEAKNDLARDEQIFEMKNAEIKRLQAVLIEAKAKNDKLIERVQELERGGQLWSNAGVCSPASAPSPPSAEKESKHSDPEEEEETNSSRVTSTCGKPLSRGTKIPSSRGLFTRRAGRGTFDVDEDNVLIGNHEEEDSSKLRALSKSKSVIPAKSIDRTVISSRGNLTSSSGTPSANQAEETSGKLEKTIISLRTKIEELQQQNGELLHAREESTRRWQIDRQNYERQINEAELTIESLRNTNQSLEDTIIEEKQSMDAKSVSRRSHTLSAKETLIMLQEDGAPQSKDPTRSSTARSMASEKGGSPIHVDIPDILTVFEDCIRQLLEYNDARRQVLSILKEKKEAQQNKDEATRRVNALEMQKMRHSLSVRESISDVSKSLQLINEKMQVENRTLDEIERLTKLKVRAERKLKTLRRQEEKEEFLDGETQQELMDLEELIEDLDSHIAFQDSELQAARNELDLIKKRSQVEEESPVDGLTKSIVHRLGPKQEEAAIAVIRKCLEEISRLRFREQELMRQLQACEGRVEERSEALAQLESGFVAARKEFDRRLILQQEENAGQVADLQQKLQELINQQQLRAMQPQELELPKISIKDEEWQKMIVSSQKKDEYITDLEKHVVFYKSKAKQMQIQLQQLIRDSTSGSQHPNDLDAQEDNRQLQRRIQQLEEANDTLMKDLASAKIYLRSSHGRSSGEVAKVVRVSKSELRELPAPTASLSHVTHD